MAQVLPEDQIRQRLNNLPGWRAAGDGIEKQYDFADYCQTIAFVNATAWISHREDHHPDLAVGYNKVVVRYSTHSAGGVTEKDLACAQKVEALMQG